MFEPCFFTGSAEQLFGAYHAPRAEARKTGVVLCYPFGHEYIRIHRAYRQLALRLAGGGHPVLRFDFSGTGDSGGGDESHGLDAWIGDTMRAADLLRARGHVSQLCLVGARLGALVATQAAVRRHDVTHLVLWDPVAHGRSYMEELQDGHRAMLETAHLVERRNGGGAATERMGFTVGPALEVDLRNGARLLPAGRHVAARVLLIGEGGDDGPLAARLRGAGAMVDAGSRGDPPPWAWKEDVAQAVIPAKTLDAIGSWIGAACP